MINRCTKENHINYEDYGGRGITVCEKWLKYENFEEDMYESYVYYGYDNGEESKDKATLDRIDNNKGYSKENCRWVTMKAQANNRRRSVKERLFQIDGEVKNLTEWEKHFCFKNGTLKARIYRYGWSFEKAIKQPVDSSRYKR